jgi:hypothetical protein
MSAPCLIVCEKKGRIGPMVRSQLGKSGGLPIVETRGLMQTAAALADSPGSLAAVEVSRENLPQVLDWLSRIERDHPTAKAVVLLTDDDVTLDALLREAGAIDVLHSVREAPRLVRLARRHLALAPKEQLTFREWAWQRLPWQGHATGNG